MRTSVTRAERLTVQDANRLRAVSAKSLSAIIDVVSADRRLASLCTEQTLMYSPSPTTAACIRDSVSRESHLTHAHAGYLERLINGGQRRREILQLTAITGPSTYRELIPHTNVVDLHAGQCNHSQRSGLLRSQILDVHSGASLS